jgi:CubicO group peptidase (beta-lactamase class C family)
MPSIRLSNLFAVVLLIAPGHTSALAEKLPELDAKAAGLKPARLEHIDALLRDAVERKRIAGGVALLMRHGKLGYLQAIGWQDVEAKLPMKPDTLFRIASMTKPITSVAVMMLVEDGKLRLDDPVSKYLPEFKAPKVLRLGEAGAPYSLKPAEREITLHDLLTHTSGITYRFWGRKPFCDLYREAGVSDGVVHSAGTSAENVRRLAKQPLLFQPGSAWEYGLSTDVLGRVVEVASGKDLDAFFRERIFRPLKMEDTFFFVPEAKKGRLATLYTTKSDQTIVRVGDKPVTVGELAYSATYPYEKDGKYHSGGAGLVSTARDYARFLQMLLNGGEWNGVRLLKAETVQRMTSNQIGDLKFYIENHGDRFGYGFGVWTAAGKGGAASAGSYSWGGLFHTYFWVDPKKELIGVLMTQVYPFDHLSLRRDFRKRTYQSLVD